jgi:hypothetical protein
MKKIAGLYWLSWCLQPLISASGILGKQSVKQFANSRKKFELSKLKLLP